VDKMKQLSKNYISRYPNRKPQRLGNYNYSQPGYYFVTITLDNKISVFGKIIDGNIKLNKFGKVVDKCWKDIPCHFPECKLDKYVIMPDHFHGIIQIVRNRHACSVQEHACSVRRQNQLLPLIIGGFKSASSRLIHQLGYHDFKWHKSYNDRILRKDELNCKRKYINDNPKKFQYHDRKKEYLTYLSSLISYIY
jgi:REP element-mobilizing transposase RayT